MKVNDLRKTHPKVLLKTLCKGDTCIFDNNLCILRWPSGEHDNYNLVSLENGDTWSELDGDILVVPVTCEVNIVE